MLNMLNYWDFRQTATRDLTELVNRVHLLGKRGAGAGSSYFLIDS